ncbi:54S ribosomal protein L3 mitochondrial [Hypoxylon texense]
MSLHRWSLARRALSREKSKDTDSSQHGSVSTVHISNPGTRRRSHLSSAFASLFDDDKNRQDASSANGSLSRNDSRSRPLSVRVNNLAIPANMQFVKFKDGPPCLDSPISTPKRGRSVQSSREQGKASNEASMTTPPKGADSCPSSKEDEVRYKKSPPSLSRVRSASSSYPSEGLRSSPEPSRSPQLNTWTEGFESELSRYGTYQAQEMSSNSTVSTTNVPARTGRVGQCLMEELAAAGGISDTDTGITSKDCNSKPALSNITSVESFEENDKSAEAVRGPTLVTETRQEVKGSPLSQEDTLHMLGGQRSSTSAIRGSIPDLHSFAANGSSEDYFTYGFTNGSSECLRPSTETGAEHFAKMHLPPRDNPYNTMPASISVERCPQGLVTFITPHPDNAQVDGTNFAESSEASVTAVQRVHSFKLRKWIKKVAIRTKVRFDSAIKLEASSNARGEKKSKFRRSLRPKKRGGAKKAKPKSKSARTYWPSTKASKKAKKSLGKEDEGKGNRFLRALKARRSMQLPEQDKQQDEGHRRAQSCPP